MDKLNYDVLKTVFEAGKDPPFEVTNIDVRRLRDDRSEIQLGQEIAFVATASFRTSQAGVAELTRLLTISDLAVGDELLVIGTDAELRSDKLEIDADSVALWLHHHYKFKFLLNGHHRDDDQDVFRPVGHIQVKTGSPEHHHPQLALPWLTKLNTATVKDDYIDVDVRIEQRPPPVVALPRAAEILAAFPPMRGVGAARALDLIVQLELDNTAASAAVLAGKTFRVPLDDAGVGLRLSLAFSEAGDPATHKLADRPPAQPGKSNKNH